MKVWFDHQVFSVQRYGGVSRYFVELLRGLQQIDGVDATVVAPAHFNAYLNATDRQHPLSFHLPYPAKGMRFRPGFTAPVFRLAQWFGRPDVVHETHYMLGSKHLSDRYKVVTTCHDMVVEKQSKWMNGSEHRRVLRKQTFERADAIICISDNTRRDLLEVYPQFEPKVFTVHHGVDQTPAPTALSVTLPKPYLLYVGVRSSYKNFDRLLQALGRSKTLRDDFQLLCFGGGAFTAPERQLALDSGFNPERMHLLSGDDRLLAYAYANASAFVFPSLFEGFGMPLTEAMVHDCPIACSDASCFPEICGDAARYFNGEDVDDIARMVEEVATAPRSKQQLERKARATHFTWQRCAIETAGVYCQTTGVSTGVGAMQVDPACP